MFKDSKNIDKVRVFEWTPEAGTRHDQTSIRRGQEHRIYISDHLCQES